MKIVDRNNSFFSTSDIVAALDWLNVNRPNVDVVSMSLFTNATFNSTCDQAESFTQALFTAVQNLVAKNVLVVAIAGNSSGVGFLPAPGCLSNVVAVGAVDTNDTPAGFSNSHPNVEYFAPGVSILTPALGGAYALATGTSFACPHVSAAAALMKQAGGGATNQAIRQQLSPGES
jgi:subtilisin family serine protease